MCRNDELVLHSLMKSEGGKLYSYGSSGWMEYAAGDQQDASSGMYEAIASAARKDFVAQYWSGVSFPSYFSTFLNWNRGGGYSSRGSKVGENFSLDYFCPFYSLSSSYRGGNPRPMRLSRTPRQATGSWLQE